MGNESRLNASIKRPFILWFDAVNLCIQLCECVQRYRCVPLTTVHYSLPHTHTQTHTKRSHFVSSTIEQKNVIFYPTIGYTHRRNAATATRFDIKIDCARSHSKWQKWNSIEVGSVSTKCQPRRMRLLWFKSKCVANRSRWHRVQSDRNWIWH